MQSIDLDWLIELIPDAALLVGPDHIVAAANTRADTLFGASPGGLKQRALETLIPEKSRSVHRKNVDDFFSEAHCRPMGNALKYEGRRLDGVTVPMDIMLNRVEIAGQALTMAVLRDDSDRQAMRDMKDELEAVSTRLSRAQEVGGLGWWELESTTMRLRWSTMVPALLGLPEDIDPTLDTLLEQCHPEDRQELRDWYRNLPETSGKQRVFRIRREDGSVRWIQETIDAGCENRMLGVIRDITMEKSLEDRLRKESVTDELTGLYNRKQFNRDLKSRFSSYVRDGQNTVVVMYDFDHFKNINDCHGHMVGDSVLSQSARIVTGQLRPSDQAYRLGGEEFAIIIGDVAIDDAFGMADRLRRSIESTPFRAGDSIIRATVSVGIARFHSSDTQPGDALRRADEALYRSKALSRNRTSLRD